MLSIRRPTVLPQSRAVNLALPSGQARRLLDRARAEWGPDGVEQHEDGAQQVVLWLGGRSQFAGQRLGNTPGAFRLRFDVPARGTATVDRISWDPAIGGSEAEVRAVINALVGWPLAS